MKLQTWQLYIPDVGDNRAKHQAGEPAIAVMVRPPTARVWWRFWLAVTESPKWSGTLAARKAEFGEQTGIGMTLRLAMLDEELAALLWMPSVGAITHFPDLGPKTPTDGRGLWAIRDELDNPDIYIDILESIIQATTLDEGLASFLVSASGPPPSRTPANTPDGVVALVATPSPS